MTSRETNTLDFERPRPHHLAGTAALLFAATILFLGLIDRDSQLSFMPASWFSYRTIWYCLGFISFLTSVLLLKNSAPNQEQGLAASESRDVRFHSVTLYTRENCPLCDEAKETLRDYGRYLPEIDERDIDADPELVKQFGECVPVVVIDDKIRFRGRVSETLLQRLIDGAAPHREEQMS